MPEDLSIKQIKENLDFLKSRLFSKPTAVDGFCKLPKEYTKNVIDSNFSQNSLQKISDHMGYFLGILKSVKVTFIEAPTDSKWTVSNDGMIYTGNNIANTSGLYSIKGYDHSEILLIKKNKYQLKHILAILAHEYTHHYLYKYNIRKNKVEENEILTEIATAYLGLGQFLVNGYEPIVWTSDHYNTGTARSYTTHTMTIGYVTPETIKKAIILSTELRKWDPKEVVGSFSSMYDKLVAFFKLRSYGKRLKLAKQKEKQDVIKNKEKKEQINSLREDLADLEKKYKEITLDFNKYSQTINPSLISARDGKQFVELANEISVADLVNTINKCSKNLEGEEKIDSTKKEINNINNRIKTWQELLNKYK